MIAEKLISRLEKVKPTGKGTWIACCPAHDDRRPSMTIREAEDGKVLVHCFGGCDVGAIVGAVGLELDDLFPPRPKGDYSPPMRRVFPAADVLEAVSEESLYVAVVACSMAHGYDVTQDMKDRLLTAQSRIEEARRLALG